MTYRLTEEELRLIVDKEQRLTAHYLATGKQATLFYNPAKKKKVDTKSLAAELAAARLLELEYDFEFIDRCAYDIITPGGLRIDVKHCDRPDAMLYVKKFTVEDHVCDIYCLMTGGLRSLTFRGWVDRETLKMEGNDFVNDPNRPQHHAYGLKQHRLKDFLSLQARISQYS